MQEVPQNQIIVGDCLEILRTLPDQCIDLTMASPPYSDARLYGELGFKLKGDAWVEWAVTRFMECYRVTRGLTAWVVGGRTKQFQWDATPALLMAELHKRGVKLRNPPIFHRVGIPGSGGPDWLRADAEFVICASHGKLPWSDNTAMGHECKYQIGGEMSYRNQDGQRRNTRTGVRLKRPKGSRLCEVANPGTVIHLKVGGGLMGHDLAHENEAPFPEALAEFFVRSFASPGGLVLDCYSGSGTTLCSAKRWGRNYLGIDCRESQKELAERRLADPRYTPAPEAA